ncbi:MAG: serine--tRNA ligase, partial [Armatimonadota bacterium]|nr:serine--tRNA ligase [Armatimonadota bacterium]
MLDIRFIRANPEVVKAGLEAKGAEAVISDFLEKDHLRRDKLQEVEHARHLKKQVSDKVSQLKKAGIAADDQIAQSRDMDLQLSEMQVDLKTLDDELERLLLGLPNLPDETTPLGRTPEENVEVRRWGTMRDPAGVQPHWDIGPALGFDFERGAKIAGSGFVAYIGQ